MSALLALPIAAPLVAAGVATALAGSRRTQRAVALLGLGAAGAASVALLVTVLHRGAIAIDVGGWAPPLGITLLVDELAALLLVTAMSTMLIVIAYAMGDPRGDRDHGVFHPVYLVLAAGIAASLLTADLFNLFVAFEVTLTASYVLLTLGASRPQVRGATTYVVVSLLTTTLLLMTIALLYAAVGTVNLAELAGRLDAVPAGLRAALGTLLFVVFGIKAAIFPLFFWLPASYPTASIPVAAVFAGLLTQLGMYAIVRTQTLLFFAEAPSALMLTLAAATMVAGVLGALACHHIRQILSFQVVSEIGFVLFGLALFSVAGLAAAIFFMVHQAVVKASLFLANGLIERVTGGAHLGQIGGVRGAAPLVGVLFGVPALSLAGVPPFSGFVGKLALVHAGFDAGAYLTTATSLVVSLLALVSMSRIWGDVFWGAPEGLVERATLPRLMVAPTVLLVGLTMAVAAAAGPLYSLAEQAAGHLVDPQAYVTAVLRR